jgi:hypothetical protein
MTHNKCNYGGSVREVELAKVKWRSYLKKCLDWLFFVYTTTATVFLTQTVCVVQVHSLERKNLFSY